MCPLPEEIGPIMCIIRVDKSGVNKFAPKYYLTLAEVNAPMLMASKIQSITTHIQIKIDSQFVSFIAKGQETLIGRLRANNSNDAYFVFDKGVNPKDVKPGNKL